MYQNRNDGNIETTDRVYMVKKKSERLYDSRKSRVPETSTTLVMNLQ